MYQLFIANKNYSSWSIRPWVLMTHLDIAFEENIKPFAPGSNKESFRSFSPSGTVPCLHHNDTVVWDSLAIIEYLADNHDGVWPDDLNARAWARSAAAEMHSGFSTLRGNCGMNIGVRVSLNQISPVLQNDVNRIDQLWREGLDKFGGPFLAGETFTAVDAFYAPVVYRIQTYGLELSQASKDYTQTMLHHPAMKKCEKEALEEIWIDQEHDDEIKSFGEITQDFRTGISQV